MILHILEMQFFYKVHRSFGRYVFFFGRSDIADFGDVIFFIGATSQIVLKQIAGMCGQP